VKLIHFADLHAANTTPRDSDRNRLEMALESLDVLTRAGREEAIDIWVFSGDMFHAGMQNSERGGLPDLYEAVRRMLDIAPMVAVSGTPTHDLPGCYEIFRTMRADYGFTLLQPGATYLLGDTGSVAVTKDNRVQSTDRAVIFGLPEPQKDWLLANTNGMGRDEALVAMQEMLREMLLGIAARRRAFANLPCIFNAHINVSGTSTCTGHVLGEHDLRIGKDDLALVGADYLALGHIHLAQQVGDLPAYYAGDAYPENWGELDRKGANLVTIEGHGAEVTRIPFPHPPRKKIVTGWNDEPLGEDEFDNPVNGFQVWHQYRVTKEEAAEIKPDEILKRMYAWGALPGSRVTVDIIPTETVRAGEIREKRRLRDKVVLWAENAEREISEAVLDKADRLEAEARREGLTSEGAHIRVRKLKVRGSVGLWKGQGVDDYELDLDRYDPGLIALVGANGSGKTTLLEMMQPFTELPTRGGALQTHFRLKDSSRELLFVDEKKGTEYRALSLMDPTLSQPAAEYHLYRSNGNGFEPMTKGRQGEYKTEIEKLYGSFPLFLRSAFITQKPGRHNPDLAEPGDPKAKRAMFRELGGLDYYEVYARKAKEYADALRAEVVGLNGQVTVLAGLVEQLPSKRAEAESLAVRLQTAETQLAAIEEAGKLASHEVEDLRAEAAENSRVQSSIDALKDQLQKLRADRKLLDGLITSYEEAVKGQQGAETVLESYENMRAEEAELNEKRAEVLKERERLQEAHRVEKDRVDAIERSIRRQKDESAQKLAALRERRVGLGKDIDALIQTLAEPLDENCPTCGQLLPEDRRIALEERREDDKARLAAKRIEHRQVEDEIAVLGGEINVFQQEIDRLPYPETPALPEFNDKGLAKLREQMRWMKVDEARETLRKAHEATAKTGEAKLRIAEIEHESEKIVSRIDDLSATLDATVQSRLAAAVQRYEDVRQQYVEAKGVCASTAATAKRMGEEIRELEAKSEELDEIRTRIRKGESEQREWMFLQEACGEKGIQALELDAMGPDVSAVANRILSSAFGTRFQIEVRTTRTVGRGKDRHQNEDFSIVVHDSRDGTEQTLDLLSGGELVWIKKAVHDAFGIIREQATGTKFLTVVQDECDGALDPEARQRYLTMLEASHKEAGRHHTIIITHSQSIQEMIAQKIDMGATALSEVG